MSKVANEHRTTIESHRWSLLSYHWPAWPGRLFDEPEAGHPRCIFFATLFYLAFHKLDLYYMSRTSHQLSADPLPTFVDCNMWNTGFLWSDALYFSNIGLVIL